ncbi:MAG: hypothetical protein H6837_21580 [Planctomycetes bacterium]|nr:hypothetical protein [Planctomycetota bacterium]
MGVLAVAALVASLPGQGESRPGERAAGRSEPNFAADQPPHGKVLDQDGKPVAGARVYFRTELDSADSVHWRNTVLRSQPLPSVRTSRDGEFFLPLTELHRLFSPQTAGSMSLVVEKEGFHPWVEPLPNGVRGYLGSKVELHAVTANQMLAVTIDKPPAGALLRIRRFSNSAAPHLTLDQWYPIPASGKLAVPVSFVPSPFALGTLNNLVLPIGVEAQLVCPGCTGTPERIELDQKELTLRASPDPKASVCQLRHAGGAALQQPRGLYRCPDGEARWLAVDPQRVVDGQRMGLLAVEAAGCLAVDVNGVDPSQLTIDLKPIPTVERRILELRDDEGNPVEGADARFFDLVDLPVNIRDKQLGPARARRRMTVQGCRVELPDSALPMAGFLLIQARGFAPYLYFEPREIPGTRTVSLGRRQRVGALDVTVVDIDGRPVPGAYAVLNSGSFELGACLGRMPRTDAKGRMRIDHLRPGNHTVQIVAPGFTQVSTFLRVTSGRPTPKSITVSPVERFRVLIVDEKDRPVPFAPVRVYASFQNNALNQIRSQLRTNTSLTSDSMGRILVLDYPAALATRVSDMFGILRMSPGPLESGTLNRVVGSATLPVVMPLGNQPVHREALTATARTNNRTVPVIRGCGAVLARFPSMGGDMTLNIYLRHSEPLRLTEEILERQRKAQGGRLPLRIDQRSIARSIDFKFAGLGDTRTEFRVELSGMNFQNGRPYLYGDSGLRVRRDASGSWKLALRDLGSATARLLHPEFLLKTVEIPASEGKPQTIDVKLTRGTPLRISIRSSRNIQDAYRFNFYVYDANNQMKLYVSATAEECLEIAKDRKSAKFVCPVALDPGKHYITLRIVSTNVNVSRKTIEVRGHDQVDLEVRDRSMTVPDEVRRDAEQLRTSLEKLKLRAAALRKLDQTDAKSKAALEATRRRLEEQIAELMRQLARESARQKGNTEAPLRRR